MDPLHDGSSCNIHGKTDKHKETPLPLLKGHKTQRSVFLTDELDSQSVCMGQLNSWILVAGETRHIVKKLIVHTHCGVWSKGRTQ